MDMRLIRLGRKILPRPIVAWLTKWLGLPARMAAVESALSLLALSTLRQTYPGDGAEPALDRHEIKVHSQNGEDGILLYLFSRIGATNRSFVEFGLGRGVECNSFNLLLNWAWRGVLIEADAEVVALARAEYDRHLVARSGDAVIVHARIARENVNAVLLEHAHDREPDLLSIDIDGNDYWVWERLTALTPRVVVIEYNAALGPERSLTVTYDPQFGRWAKHRSGFYHGASLKALERLGRQKGYLLVGCDSSGVNAFFVRRDVAGEELPAVPAQVAYRPLAPRHSGLSCEERYELIRDLGFEEV